MRAAQQRDAAPVDVSLKSCLFCTVTTMQVGELCVRGYSVMLLLAL